MLTKGRQMDMEPLTLGIFRERTKDLPDDVVVNVALGIHAEQLLLEYSHIDPPSGIQQTPAGRVIVYSVSDLTPANSIALEA